MSDFGKIQWETKAKRSGKKPAEGADSFEFFLNYCKAKLPAQDLTKSYKVFLSEREHLQGELKNFIDAISKQPLLTAFLAWVKEASLIPNFNINLARSLLENGLIGISDKKGKLWTIENAKDFDHQSVLDAIRCHSEWATTQREDLVGVYISFVQWLSNVTFGYIDKIEDPDLMRTQARTLPYPLFLNFIANLKEKDRLVAKLLYFGGSRTLEEVLDLKIENIDFDNRCINFESQPTIYPLHIFSDLKALAKDRKKGRLFLGRQNAALNPATMFRNFKEAATESGLGKNFTPKALTINR